MRQMERTSPWPLLKKESSHEREVVQKGGNNWWIFLEHKEHSRRKLDTIREKRDARSTKKPRSVQVVLAGI